MQPTLARSTFDAQGIARWQYHQSTSAERKAWLSAMESWIRTNRTAITDALHADLGKHPKESVLTEILPCVEELHYTKRRLHKWMKPRRVPRSLFTLGAKSSIYPQAKGRVLVLVPFNYPFQLAIAPLLSAIAAGNTVIIKPSEKTPRTSAVIARLVRDVFDSKHAAVVEGEADLAQELTALPFDHIFFTGSTAVGRHVMRAAAANLATVTLELGGKSPALVLESADLPYAARTIAWGRFLNTGQTCVAPDYALVPKKLQPKFLEHLGEALAALYGPKASRSKTNGSADYGKIIDGASLTRLTGIQKAAAEAGASVFCGGEADPSARFLAPTVLTNVTWNSPAMTGEIFGPILPVLTYDDVDTAVKAIVDRDPPLALYVFGEHSADVEKVRARTQSGAFVVNQAVAHLAETNLPFGGIGPSGQGAYHGQFGFDTFSHLRPVFDQRHLRGLLQLFQPPYEGNLSPLKKWAWRALEKRYGL